MNVTKLARRMIHPLASRKVRVALVTVLAAGAAEWGLDVDEELIMTILAVGSALILGIAHEDAGKAKVAPPPEQSLSNRTPGGA